MAAWIYWCMALAGSCLAASVDAACPHQSDDLQSWSEAFGGQIPGDGDDIVVDVPVLLDTETAALGIVRIVEGGRIVFSPDVPLAKLSAQGVRIEDGGSLDIGGADAGCAFAGNAEILLLGEFDAEDLGDEDFGKKYLAVTAGGSLIINGAEKRSWTKITQSVGPDSTGQVTLNVADDVSSWLAGDKIVIASTDYEMLQAEELEVQSITDNGFSIVAAGVLNYTHYGEINYGVDMQAEVGLLTRNIRIHGEMGDSCIGGEANGCDEVINFDNFGGHTMAIEGFKNYSIVGAELFNMGQMAQLGRYPIHFHMCKETDYPLIANNAIHHCFSRCVTIHGTHNVQIVNNVAHDTFGHCFFLEDGGERNTLLDSNLGLTTRLGMLTPTDSRPSTFWITSPLTAMRNNVAAGSDRREGTGIWWLFPDSPVGPSASVTPPFFQEGEARLTPITECANNVAHSNGKVGLAFFERLSEDHGFDGCSTYSPKEDVLDKYSASVQIVFDGFTGYKNGDVNAYIRVLTSLMRDFRLADSNVGIRLIRNTEGGYQLVENCTIVGQSDNLGEPERIKVIDEETGEYKHIEVNRSYPKTWSAYTNLIGVKIQQAGACHLLNVNFVNLGDQEGIRKGCSVEFEDNYHVQQGAFSTASGLEWTGNSDGSKICNNNVIYAAGDSSTMLRDEDGSLTDAPGTTILSPTASLGGVLRGLESCAIDASWNMSVCPDQTFAKFKIKSGSKRKNVYVIDSDDLASGKDGAHASVYTAVPDTTPVLYRTNKLPVPFILQAIGMESSTPPIILGVCIPSDATKHHADEFIKATVNGKDKPIEGVAESLDSLRNDPEMQVFVDKAASVAYFKFVETRSRNVSSGSQDLADCIKDPETRIERCPEYKIHFGMLAIPVDLNDGDCRALA